MNTKELEYNATVIALRHYFCGISLPSEEELLLVAFDNGFESLDRYKHTVWFPFEECDDGELYDNVSNLRDDIIRTFTHNEPNNNNDGYVGRITVLKDTNV